jgi:hypothetical protein
VQTSPIIQWKYVVCGEITFTLRKYHVEETPAEPIGLTAEATYLTAKWSLSSAKLNYVIKIFIYLLSTHLWFK